MLYESFAAVVELFFYINIIPPQLQSTFYIFAGLQAAEHLRCWRFFGHAAAAVFRRRGSALLYADCAISISRFQFGKLILNDI